MGTRAGAIHHHSTRHQAPLLLGLLGWVLLADAGFAAWVLARYLSLAALGLRLLLVFVGAEGAIAAVLIVSAALTAARERGPRSWRGHPGDRDRAVDVQALARRPVTRSASELRR